MVTGFSIGPETVDLTADVDDSQIQEVERSPRSLQAIFKQAKIDLIEQFYLPSLRRQDRTMLLLLQETFTPDDLHDDLDVGHPVRRTFVKQILCECHKDVLKMMNWRVIDMLRSKLVFDCRAGMSSLFLWSSRQLIF